MQQSQVQIQQGPGIVTVSPGEVPVIKTTSNKGLDELIMAMNFLRSGCPAVQLVSEYGGSQQWEATTKEHVGLLQVAGEEITVERGNPHAKWGNPLGGDTYILVLTAKR